ncbi:MAG: hypothetical protein M3167_06060 [Acidobacteriota bacterium]|nr:hypothetical protein [Acidobacteriota bacterium]
MILYTTDGRRELDAPPAAPDLPDGPPLVPRCSSCLRALGRIRFGDRCPRCRRRLSPVVRAALFAGLLVASIAFLIALSWLATRFVP